MGRGIWGRRICGALLLSGLACAATHTARADDTCWNTPGVQGIDCSGPGVSRTPARPSAAAPRPTQLRDQLTAALNQSARQRTATRAAMNNAAARFEKADTRLHEIIAQAAGTNDPKTLARLQTQFDTAMGEYRRAAAALVAADTSNADRWQNMATQRMTEANQFAANAGLQTQGTAAAAPAAPPPQPTPPPDRYEVCGLAGAGGTQSCYVAPPIGLGCDRIIRLNGDTVSREHMDRCDRADILEARNAFFKAYPAVVASQQRPFDDSEASARAEIGRLTATRPEPAADPLAGLPPVCQPGVKALMDAASQGGAGRAAAVESFGRLNAIPACRDALQQLARQNGIATPERRLDAPARAAFEAAMTADASERTSIVLTGPSGSDSGFDAGEVVDFGLSVLGILGGVAGNLRGVSSMPAIRAAAPAIRAVPAPQAIRPLPAPAPVAPSRGHAPDCTFSAYENSMFCK